MICTTTGAGEDKDKGKDTGNIECVKFEVKYLDSLVSFGPTKYAQVSLCFRKTFFFNRKANRKTKTKTSIYFNHSTYATYQEQPPTMLRYWTLRKPQPELNGENIFMLLKLGRHICHQPWRFASYSPSVRNMTDTSLLPNQRPCSACAAATADCSC